ncbi:hypothetical protein BKA67DRAFT_573167 [Truncatella angustata]|uniref:FAD-binding FR-type domain-containing protein n=1 Tax=Truncatella angustata TaxID=152316 RepID=A0A9P8UHC6_9PEZI|nr:uncharacterized protein BKA67DRAFT_573167 [Truncatella angustata]KAH6652161.1 hypothetical protein BKA67DRAFT_573167 [Truncatella angustata]
MSSSRVCSSCVRASQVRPRQTLHLDSLTRHALQRQAPLQASTRLEFSTSIPRQESKHLVAGHQVPRKSKIPLLFSLTAAALGGAAYYALSGESEDDSLNGTKFTPFNIIAKEQVSPTAFIITIACPEKVATKNNAKIKAAWDHGLWSVEMKQPQLQIARHYTPLPPLNNARTDENNLRFLIRKMDSGEMSNYLARLQVGDQVWLRGPHYGFDVAKRMGDAKDVVFLAGGTGVAPALQIARKLLGDAEHAAGGRKPAIQILWANRRNIDSLGREALTGKAKRAADNTASDTLTKQIVEMKRGYGDSFNVQYFVDDEKFITLQDVNAAVANQTGSEKRPFFAATDKRCRWHSHQGLATTSDEDDKDAGGSPCSCRPHNMPPEPIGRNLLCVSGPDGFIEAFAGPKRWFGGKEIQGPVLGLLGSMKRIDPKMDDWLVLKM